MDLNDELTAAVKAVATEREGRSVLRCSDAFRLAEAHSVEVGVIGAVCNAGGIKVVQCQLGCFK